MNTEAIEEYEKLLKKEPTYVPALKGMHRSTLFLFFIEVLTSKIVHVKLQPKCHLF